MSPLEYSFFQPEILDINEIKNLGHKSTEQVVMIFINKNKIITTLCGKRFGRTWATAPPLYDIISCLISSREYVNDCIVVHNHPDDLPSFNTIIPSNTDIVSTEILKWQFALLGINLLDHIIICGDRNLSLFQTDLYNPSAGIKINGFEVKRFLYCFLVQMQTIFEKDFFLAEIVNALETHLDKLRFYYDQPFYSRLFKTEPEDFKFQEKLLWLQNLDDLLQKLVKLLIKLKNGKNMKIDPQHVIPHGMELQDRITTLSQ